MILLSIVQSQAAEMMAQQPINASAVQVLWQTWVSTNQDLHSNSWTWAV